MQVNILIPVYKGTMSDAETMSLQQCLSVLSNYQITMVTNKNVNLTTYKAAFQTANVVFSCELFDEKYFGTIEAYSQMLLSKEFYLRFQNSTFILIYQLDGFVFKDELTYWCLKDYAYIGAPLFKPYGRHKKENKFWKVGNGGISLRKVSSFLNKFDQPLPLSAYPFFVRNIRKKGIIVMSLKTLKMLFLLAFTKKSVEFYLQHYTDERINEDLFWIDCLSRTSLKLKVPDIKTAARFCIEKSPSYLFNLIGQQMPFTCHAYEKFEYDVFWKDKIEGKNTIMNN